LLKFLNSTPARLVTVFLVLQMAVLWSSVRTEYIPSSRALASMPREFVSPAGTWNMFQESQVDKESEEILKADDTLNRGYKNTSTGANAFLFVASFKSQRNGKAPHSPKNCMPGSGWTQLSSENLSVDTGQGYPIVVNRYVIVHAEQRELVLYWYQSRDRVVADEFKAKFWVVADAIKYNRTDTALVRVIVNITNLDEAAATKTATDFVRAFFVPLKTYLPS
jgi:EpsI family protein